MNPRGARVLITGGEERIYEEHVADLETADEQVYQAMRDTVPLPKRRTPEQRLQATMQPMVEQAVTSYTQTGRIRWPRSAEVALAEIARLNNDPTLLQDGGVEQVIRQGKALARWIVERGEQQQKAQDRKKVTLDWAGH